MMIALLIVPFFVWLTLLRLSGAVLHAARATLKHDTPNV